MNPLNKKINKIDTNKDRNKKFHRAHSSYKDLKYWDWVYLEDENDRLIWTAVIQATDYCFYEYETCNIMNIPLKQGGKRYGKK